MTTDPTPSPGTAAGPDPLPEPPPDRLPVPVPVRVPRGPRISPLWWFTGPALLALVVTLVVVAALPVPYFTISPGMARSVNPLITLKQVKGGPEPHEEEANDDLLFLTVSVRQPAGIEALWALRDDTVEVVPEEIITGGQTRAENTKFNLQLMTDSKDKAAKVALERAGYEVPVRSTGAVVVDLDPTLPVADVLSPGDTIVAADGQKVTTRDDLVGAIAAHEPGEHLSLTVEPLGSPQRRQVRAELVPRPDDATKAMLGVSLEDRPSYQFPIEVDIDSGSVGGPSAGLAFTLAILDRLTPGDLTGGRKVAVTGTIGLDGSVGPVGGVAQKTEAAVREGAELFLVPPDEYEVARATARGRIKVRKVATLDDALAALEDLGGDPIPAVTTRSAP